MLCVPGSGGQTAACSTPSAPGGARHRSSEGRGTQTEMESVNGGFDTKKTNSMSSGYNGYTRQTWTHLSDQSEGPVEAPGVGVLPDFVVEPAELGQSAAGVSQGLAQHHLLRHGTYYNTCMWALHPVFVYSSWDKQEVYTCNDK